jgi:hypothetical protein
MSFEAFLLSDELVIPLLMIVFGGASVGFHSFLKSYLEKRQDGASSQTSKFNSSHFHLDEISQRFEQRRKISLLLTLVGVLWLSIGFVSEVIARAP